MELTAQLSRSAEPLSRRMMASSQSSGRVQQKLPGAVSFPDCRMTVTKKAVTPATVRITAGGSGPGLADEQEQGKGFEGDLPPVPSGRMMVPMMKKGYGAFGGGGATLEKSKLDLSFSQTKLSPQVSNC